MANIFVNRQEKQIPPDVMQEIMSKSNELLQLARPYMDSMNAEEKKKLLRTGDKAGVFSSKAHGYASENAELQPPFVKLEDLQAHIDRSEGLRPLQRVIGSFKDMIDDSIAVASSDGYAIALAIYAQVKTAVKHNVPGAQTALDGLSPYFQGRGRTHGGETEEEAEEGAV